VIVLDLNLALYAYDPAAAQHKAARQWLEQVLAGTTEIGLPWVVALGFIRISTNSRIFKPPIPVSYAIAIVRGWLGTSCVRILLPGPRHAEILFRLIESAGAAGNLTTDAHIAGLAIENDAIVHTADKDFGRFAGCRSINPLANT
jgi:toxin-antitoxin system PIN domain toxin